MVIGCIWRGNYGAQKTSLNQSKPVQKDWSFCGLHFSNIDDQGCSPVFFSGPVWSSSCFFPVLRPDLKALPNTSLISILWFVSDQVSLVQNPTQTRQWDVYLKEGDSDYTAVNPHNFQPVFTQEQLSVSLHASAPYNVLLRGAIIINTDTLYNNICCHLCFWPACFRASPNTNHSSLVPFRWRPSLPPQLNLFSRHEWSETSSPPQQTWPPLDTLVKTKPWS